MKIRQPSTITEYAEYYERRWEVLRKPWDQPRGSEQDNLEEQSYHTIAVNGQEIVGGGRIHFNTPQEAQIRYMFILPDHQGRGVGKEVLKSLEPYAWQEGAASIVLNARENAIPFYQGQGYQIVGDAPTMFGITHKKMEKKKP